MNILKLIMDLHAIGKRGISFGPYETAAGRFKEKNCYVTDGSIIFLINSDLKVNAGGLDENGEAIEKDPVPIDKVLEANDLDELEKSNKSLTPKIEILKTIDWSGSRGSRPAKLSVFKAPDGSKIFINHGYYKLILSLDPNTIFYAPGSKRLPNGQPDGTKIYFSGECPGVMMSIRAPELDDQIQVNPMKRKKMHKRAKKNPSIAGAVAKVAVPLVAGLALGRAASSAAAKKNPVKHRGEVDKIAAHELFLYAINDNDLYRQQRRPIELNLLKKFKKGTYNKDLAIKLWGYFADTAAKKYDNDPYNKEFGGMTGTFNKATRMEAAKEFEARWRPEMKIEAEFDALTPAQKKRRDEEAKEWFKNPGKVERAKAAAGSGSRKKIQELIAHYKKEGKAPGWYSPLTRGLVSGTITLDDRFKNQVEIAGDLKLIKKQLTKSGHTWKTKI